MFRESLVGRVGAFFLEDKEEREIYETGLSMDLVPTGVQSVLGGQSGSSTFRAEGLASSCCCRWPHGRPDLGVGVSQQGLCQGVLAGGLSGSSQVHELQLRDAAGEGLMVCDRRLTLCEGSRLVKDHDLHLLRSFQGGGPLQAASPM